MIKTSGLILLAGAIASGTPTGRIEVKALWSTAPHVRGNVFVELRCRGLSPDAARKRIVRRYSKREKSIEHVIGASDTGEILPIGRHCPYYTGSVERYDRLLDQIELYLRAK